MAEQQQEAPSCSQVDRHLAVASRDLQITVKTIKNVTCSTVNLLVTRGIHLAHRVITNQHIAGRLANYMANWHHVTRDQWVLDTIQGYRIEFLSVPAQSHPPRVGVTSSQEQDLVAEEVHTMLKKGAIVELPKAEAERGFYSTLPGPEEGRRLEASNKPQAPQRIHSLPPLQDGGDAHTERRSETERLDDESGSKGRIFHDPNPREGQEVPPIFHPGSSVPVQLFTFRPIVRFLGLYQDPEASDNPAQRARGTASGIHRRHPGNGRFRGASQGSYPSPTVPTGSPGFHRTPDEDSDGTDPGATVPGNDDNVPHHGAPTPGLQAEEATSRSISYAEGVFHAHGEGGVTPLGENELGFSGDSTGGPVLQNDTEGPRQRPGARAPII